MIDSTKLFSEDYDKFHNEVIDSYRTMSNGINGDIAEWTPTISGGTTVGAGAYASTTYGLWFRQGLVADVWFNVTWTAHTGTGVMKLNLPFESMLCKQDIFVGELQVSGVTFSAGYSYATICANNNTYTSNINECGSNKTMQPLNIINGSVSLVGHIRYISKE